MINIKFRTNSRGAAGWDRETQVLLVRFELWVGWGSLDIGHWLVFLFAPQTHSLTDTLRPGGQPHRPQHLCSLPRVSGRQHQELGVEEERGVGNHRSPSLRAFQGLPGSAPPQWALCPHPPTLFVKSFQISPLSILSVSYLMETIV